MTADRIRTGAYWAALQRSIRPETVVLEIGTGVGSMAILACRAGARRVYAVEADDCIHLARQIAAQNGFADRIQFIQDDSNRITLPEQADLIVSDLRGVLPLFRHHIPTIVDARQRLLSAAGNLIPKHDTLWAAVVEAPDLYKRYEDPWEQNDLGLNLKEGEKFVKNSWRKGRVSPDALLVEPVCWATLDYQSIESPDVKFRGNLTVKRPGTGHGLNIWFDTTLVEGVAFSNGPNAPELIYRSAFFPWSSPVTLASGDVISVYIGADLVGEDYVWRWNTQVFSQGNPSEMKADLNQSTFFAVPLASRRLSKQAPDYMPTLNEEGEVNSFILHLMDGETSLEQIASRLLERFPAMYADCNAALKDVNEMSLKYSK